MGAVRCAPVAGRSRCRADGTGAAGNAADGRDTERTRLFTLGYEGRSLGEVLELVRSHAIDQVLDVRENPSSKKPGFSEAELREALGRIGVSYVPLPELGCASPSRHAFWKGNPPEAFFTEYRRRLAERPHAFPDLLQRVASKRSLLLCLERDPARCHRAVLVARLREEGVVPVQDL